MVENAVRADIAAGGAPTSIDRSTARRWRRKAVVIPTAAVLALGAGVGTAATAGLFSSSPAQVANGMTLRWSSPHHSGLHDQRPHRLPVQVDNTPSGEPRVTYQQDAVYEYVIDGKVTGGCRGQDAAGLKWTCYAGQAAGGQNIIAHASSASTSATDRPSVEPKLSRT